MGGESVSLVAARGLALCLVALLTVIAAWPGAAIGGAAGAAAEGSSDAGWAEAAARRALSPIRGLPAMPHPPGSEPTPERVALGRKLFFDRRLSHNATQSCAMCHIPEQGFANNELAVAVGINGRTVRRNAPTLINIGFHRRLFVDGRESALETQYLSPLTSRDEMANPSVGHVIDLLRTLPDYAGRFEQAFGQPVSPDRLGQALAIYQRTLIGGDSPFDRWREGVDPRAIDAQARQGFALFVGKAGCSRCHLVAESSAWFTDEAFHDTGYGWHREQLRQRPAPTVRVQVAPGVFHDVDERIVQSVGLRTPEDLGRYEVTLNPADLWRYRTPSLRNVALTAPYMHDGGLATLRDVLAFYNQGGVAHAGLSERIAPLGLSNDEMDRIVDFLRTLTSDTIDELVAEARSAEPDNWRPSP